MERLMTIREFADLTGYSPQAISKWCRQGRIKSIQPGGRKGSWRIYSGEVERLATKETGATA